MKQLPRILKKCLLGSSASLILLTACNDQVKTGLSRAPGAPTDLVAEVKLNDNPNTGDVIVSWKAPTNAGTKDDGTPAVITGYQLEYTSAADFSDASKIKTVEVREAKTTLRDIEALGTTWRVRVFAKNGSKKPISVASVILEVKVGEVSMTEPALKPARPTVSSSSNNSVALIVTVDVDAENLFGKNAVGTAYKGIYRLEQTNTDPADGTATYSNTGKTILLDQKSQTITVNSGLDADTDYWFRVVAIPIDKNQDELANLSVYGDPVKAETAVATSPVPATQVTFTALSDTSVVANFTPSTDGGLKMDGTTKANIIGYKLIISDQEDFSSVVAENTVENPTASSVSVAGLTASTTYYAQLITLSDNDDPDKREAFSQVANSQVTTLPPGDSKPSLKPASPTVVSTAHSSITLSLTVDIDAENLFGTDAKGVAYNKGIYRLEQTDTDPAGGTVTYSNTGKTIDLNQRSQRVVIFDLAPSTSYWFRIVAVPIDESQNELTGLSAYGDPVRATTNISKATSPASATRVYFDNYWENYDNQGNLFEKVTARFTPSSDGGLKADGTTKAGITGYKLVISDKKDFSNTIVEEAASNVLANTEATVSITGLDPSIFYYAKLVTLSDNDDPTKRETSTPGKGLAKRPLKPKDPIVVSTTPTSITLSIEVDTANAKYQFGSNDMGLAYTGNYQLWMKDVDGSYRDTGKPIKLDQKSQNITISGLIPGTDYDFLVQINPIDEHQQILSSVSGASITATTAASKETAAVKPPTMTVKALTDTTVTLTVSGTSAASRFGTDSVGNAYEGEYHIYYKKSVEGEDAYSLFKKATSYSGSNQESFTEDYDVQVMGLTANTSYDFKIVATPVDENKNVISGKEVDGDKTTEKTYPTQPSNSYKFTYNKHLYVVVNSPSTWSEATKAAVALGGHLVYIDSLKEQKAIETGLAQAVTNLDLLDKNSKKIAFDGGGVAYVWIGATDSDTEGTWVWDDDDTNTASITIGTYASGSFTPVVGGFENFGKGGNPPGTPNEPDDYQGLQDFAGIALEDWPLGNAYQWNDIKGANTMPYIIEIER